MLCWESFLRERISKWDLEERLKALWEEAYLEIERRADALLEEAGLKVLRLKAPRHVSWLEREHAVRHLKDLQHVQNGQLLQLCQLEYPALWNFPATGTYPHFQRQERLNASLARRQKRLDQLLRQVEPIVVEVERGMEFVRTLLLVLWQMLVGGLISCRIIPEKPSKRRPPCTTMPWDIRTALAVLWGVRWMFYPWSPIEDLQLQPRSGGELVFLEDLDFDYELFGHSQLHHPVASNEPSWDFPIGDLPVGNLQSWDLSGQTRYGYLQGPHPDPFAPSSTAETQSISSAGVAPLQTTLAAPAPFSFPGKQVHGSDIGSYLVEPVLGYFSEAPSARSADQIAVSLPGTTIQTFEGAAVTLSIDRQARSIAHDDPRKGHAQLPAQSAREAAGRMERAVDIPLKLTTYRRSEEPPQNAEGKIVCKYNECSNRTFTRKCDWNKHMDKHERPYICTVDGCDHPKGFTSKGDLLRHQRIVHKSDSEQETLLFCEEPNCARGPLGGPNAAFSRPDNLAQHIRTTHGQSSANSSAGRRSIEAANDTISPDLRSESPRRMDDEPGTSRQRKRRWTSETGLGSQSTDEEEGEEMSLRRELRKATRRVDELTEELKETQKRHEKNTETLVGIIERLTQQTK